MRTRAEAIRLAAVAALRQANGNITKAAPLLGVSVRTMRNYARSLRGYGVGAPKPELAYGPGYLKQVIEREALLAMGVAGGHKGRAAALLGISVNTLTKKLQASGKYNAKPWQQPAMYCTACNGRRDARSSFARRVVKTWGRIDRGLGRYYIRQHRTGIYYACLSPGARPELALVALADAALHASAGDVRKAATAARMHLRRMQWLIAEYPDALGQWAPRPASPYVKRGGFTKGKPKR